MIYFASPTGDVARRAISDGVLACMTTPKQGTAIRPGWQWAVDTGCYTGPLNPGLWLTYLQRQAAHRERCVFAAVPDRVSDAVETRRLWEIWAPVVVEMGYRPAFVAQDGETGWPDGAGVLFMGGSTAWKRGPEAWQLAHTAYLAGLWVHWGRVNSRRRFAMAALDGHSVDGTYLTYGPDVNLPRLVGWLNPLPLGGTVHPP